MMDADREDALWHRLSAGVPALGGLPGVVHLLRAEAKHLRETLAITRDALAARLADVQAPITNLEAQALRMTVRAAARKRVPLDGADAQGLEGALTLTERERDAAMREASLWRLVADVARLTDAQYRPGPGMADDDLADAICRALRAFPKLAGVKPPEVP